LIPRYAVFGNHDYGYGQTGVEAQIERHYTDLDDGLWAMTATNYSKVFSVPGGVEVLVIFIDTTTLAPSENRCCNSEG